MKVKREKQARQILGKYKNNFGFFEPYLILIDGTFCQASLKAKIQIKDQLAKYLNSTIQCCTTKCVLSELELLGSEMYGAKVIAQRFQIRPCKHKNNPISAVECIKSLLTNNNKGRYFVATQDPGLTSLTHSIPGVPVIYIYKNYLVLEKLSKMTLQHINSVSKVKLRTSYDERSDLVALKKEANLIKSNANQHVKGSGIKRKRAKGPNPLSCKKKKNKVKS